MWSKLQKQLYNVMDLTTGFQMHCSIYKTKSAWTAGRDKHNHSKSREMIPHYWITIGKGKAKQIIWDFPNQFLDHQSLVKDNFNFQDANTIKDRMFWPENYTWVAEAIRNYLNTPKEKLLKITPEQDPFGLITVLRKYDSRLAQEKRANL